MEQKRYYIIEHMEEFLFEWSRQEYINVAKRLSKVDSAIFVISNANVFFKFEDPDQQSMESNKENIRQLQEHMTPGKCLFLENPIKDYVDQEKGLIIGDDQIEFSKICLLDMRGKNVLEPTDSNVFRALIIGGILGDHPPRDRTIKLRQGNYDIRHLGEIQLATDTATLVCKLILENQIKFENIPFCDQPEIKGITSGGILDSIQLEGFRYIDEAFDVDQGILNGLASNRPLIDAYIRDKLLFEELDINKM